MFNVFIVNQPVKIKASPKIPTAADAAKHKPGGGNVEICKNCSLYTSYTSLHDMIFNSVLSIPIFDICAFLFVDADLMRCCIDNKPVKYV